MSSILLTLMVAFVLVILAISALSIGWLISGKSKITRGGCGIDPTKTRSTDCGKEMKCGLCDTDKEEKKSEEKIDDK